ncbi:Urease accessory protein UreE [Acaryochloris thomasi RCC1774]|uniref:Urease accessory protein UreE n=1 Tax=Acaryochloris thomasi RCC1774 TaxID=1764569 RepID=A0A2W1JU59_9CYAN|nr:urease accessory protein UreE [Acaryochloris thomasi]PZD73344.1 Urease accessory protein UreE [Acaryochloris thomasi RCC1774]
MSLVFTRRLSARERKADLVLSLTAEERMRSRFPFATDDGTQLHLQLPRGTVLRDGDLLEAEADGTVLQILAKSESVLVVRANSPHELLQAAYHLGNRHVALEITPTCLRLLPDPVLQKMLNRLQLDVTLENRPFQPETGAYSHHH